MSQYLSGCELATIYSIVRFIASTEFARIVPAVKSSSVGLRLSEVALWPRVIWSRVLGSAPNPYPSQETHLVVGRHSLYVILVSVPNTTRCFICCSSRYRTCPDTLFLPASIFGASLRTMNCSSFSWNENFPSLVLTVALRPAFPRYVF